MEGGKYGRRKIWKEENSMDYHIFRSFYLQPPSHPWKSLVRRVDPLRLGFHLRWRQDSVFSKDKSVLRRRFDHSLGQALPPDVPRHGAIDGLPQRRHCTRRERSRQVASTEVRLVGTIN